MQRGPVWIFRTTVSVLGQLYQCDQLYPNCIQYQCNNVKWLPGASKEFHSSVYDVSARSKQQVCVILKPLFPAHCTRHRQEVRAGPWWYPGYAGYMVPWWIGDGRWNCETQTAEGRDTWHQPQACDLLCFLSVGGCEDTWSQDGLRKNEWDK